MAGFIAMCILPDHGFLAKKFVGIPGFDGEKIVQLPGECFIPAQQLINAIDVELGRGPEILPGIGLGIITGVVHWRSGCQGIKRCPPVTPGIFTTKHFCFRVEEVFVISSPFAKGFSRCLITEF